MSAASKKDRFANLIQKKDDPRESQAKQEMIANVNTDTIAITSTNASIENNALNKVGVYKEKARQREKQLTHDQMYQQQNVYIDRNIVAAISKVLKKNKKLKKQEAYNEALKLYLDIVHDIQVKLKSEEE